MMNYWYRSTGLLEIGIEDRMWVLQLTTYNFIMIGILQYSAGNVGSVQRAFDRLNIASSIVTSPDQINACMGLVFPGAGAAGAAMAALQSEGWISILRSYKKPFLGLCLGMQLLFDYSEENDTECLGVIRGTVQRLPDDVVRPHMGWNRIIQNDELRMQNVSINEPYAYFVHSYYCVPDDSSVITMTTNYGQKLCVGVQNNNFMGVQFHPEKSAEFGDVVLSNFAMLCK